ncbi:MAG: hypothetical protein GF408_02665 [Candidatus Omnitrophica bacterium]|nr:hypothetical protein [Candidatus Omnitrophota bacterium]
MKKIRGFPVMVLLIAVVMFSFCGNKDIYAQEAMYGNDLAAVSLEAINRAGAVQQNYSVELQAQLVERVLNGLPSFEKVDVEILLKMYITLKEAQCAV